LDTLRSPPRAIGLAGAVLINLNAVIGAGIFALPALLYAGTGSLAPLIILAFAVPVAANVAIYAKLSSLFDQSGGPELYAERAFGSFAGFQVGFFVLSQNIAARAANFHVLIAYLAAVFPVFDSAGVRLVMILALIALFTALAISGTRRSIAALWIGTALKLGPILLIGLLGFMVNGLPDAYVLPQFSQVEAIALLLAYAFSGGILATISAGETHDAKRTVGRSLYLTLGVIAAFYALVQWAYIAIDPQDVNMDRPLAAAGEAVLGQTGILLISIAAIFSTGTNQLSYFVSMPRLIFGMSRRGLLPASFSRISARFGTPALAIGLYGAVVAALALTGTFATLAVFMVALETISALLVVGALVMLWRRNEGGIAARMGWHWALIIPFSATFSIWLLAQAPVSAIVPTFVVIAVGALLYFLARRGSRASAV